MNRDESVWITGVGAATPLGSELEEIESSLLAGRSGVSLVTRFPTEDYPSRIAAQLGDIAAPPGCDVRAFSARPRLEQLAHWCVEKALRDAGLWGRSSRVTRRSGARARGRVDAALGRSIISRAARRLYDPEQDRESTIERVRRGLDLTGPALAPLGRLRQRQPRPRARPAVAAARPGRLLRGRRVRPGCLADRPGDLRQPSRILAPELRSIRCLAAVRP